MIAAALIAVIAFSLLWEYLAGRALKNAVHVTFTAGAGAVIAGEEIIFTEVIENRGRLPVPSCEVCFRTEKGLRFDNPENIAESDYLYKRDIYSLLGLERITRRYRVACLVRGRYHVSQALIRSISFPAHRVYEQAVDTDTEFFVYARRADIRDILTSVETILAERESARWMYEDPFAFAQIREYRMTDPMRSVNWKATAKMGGLMVNTYLSASDTEFSIYLDVSDRAIVKKEALVEECISIAATLCREILMKGMQVRLAVNVPAEEGPAVFGRESYGSDVLRGGEPLRIQIDRFLTQDFSKMAVMDMEELLGSVPAGSSVPLIISRNVDDRLIRKAAETAGPGRSALVVDVALKNTQAAYRSRGGVLVVRREVAS